MLLMALFWAAGVQARTVHLYYTNPQGSVLAKTDAQGNILARYDYRPYGSIVSGTGLNGPGYTGHVNDPETGLIYMQQRYDSPSEGRFLSPDPVGVSPGDVFSFNRYAYANDNPIVNIDPTGRTCKKVAHSKGYTCTVDDNHANWSKRQIKDANDAYTRAVNRLLQHPGSTKTITVDGKSFTVSAKQVANALTGSWVVTGSGHPKVRASTYGGATTPSYGYNGHPKITLFPNVLTRDRSGGTAFISGDLSRTFVHEGIHGTKAESAIVPLYKSNPTKFNNDHQRAYNIASDLLYDQPINLLQVQLIQP